MPTFATLYWPTEFETVSLTWPVALFVRSTVALGTTAPLASATLPVTVALSCAHARGVKATIIMASAIQSTPIPLLDLYDQLLLDWVNVCVMVCLLRNWLLGSLYPSRLNCSWKSLVRRVC